MLPAAPGGAGAACCVSPGKTHPHIPARLPRSPQPQHSKPGGSDITDPLPGAAPPRMCTHFPGVRLDRVVWEETSEAGLSQTPALGSVVVGAGKPQGREGGFLSGPWSHRGFAKSISPLIPGRSLTLWPGWRPVTRQAPPGPLTWAGGGESRHKKPLVGRLGPAPGPSAGLQGGSGARQEVLLYRLSPGWAARGPTCRAWGSEQGPFPRSRGSLARSQLWAVKY